MKLHTELLAIREQGVPLTGICTLIGADNEEQLEELLWSLCHNEDAVAALSHPIVIGEERASHVRCRQYHAVREDKDVPYKHDYLCERWALLNYLINETE